ncbi:MAG TPA: hypothetical protein VD866_04935 [Urbifossiella sp.]|nr:hypothetical protein [Urbifossiella sp.]
MDTPAIGSTGRTLIRLDPSGRVEVGGVVFEAETSMFGSEPRRAPVPPDRVVVVTGWRADNVHGVVLLVSDPTASEPAVAVTETPAEVVAPPTSEERLAALERKLDGLTRTVGRVAAAERSVPESRAEDPGPGWFLLTFGQVVSAVGAFFAPIYALMVLPREGREAVRPPASQEPTLSVMIGAAVACLYCAAMFVVFSRCKRVPPESASG